MSSSETVQWNLPLFYGISWLLRNRPPLPPLEGRICIEPFCVYQNTQSIQQMLKIFGERIICMAPMPLSKTTYKQVTVRIGTESQNLESSSHLPPRKQKEIIPAFHWFLDTNSNVFPCRLLHFSSSLAFLLIISIYPKNEMR